MHHVYLNSIRDVCVRLRLMDFNPSFGLEKNRDSSKMDKLELLPPVNFFRTPLLLYPFVCLSVQDLLPKRATIQTKTLVLGSSVQESLGQDFRSFEFSHSSYY